MEAVRAADRDRYLSVLYAPEDKRPSLFALYAFNAEIASVRDRIREALPGEIRLQWWRDAIANDAPGGHPLAEALLAAIRRHDLPQKTVRRLSRGAHLRPLRRPDARPCRAEGYCGETASALIQLAALVLDAMPHPMPPKPPGHAGCAQAITGLIR